MGSKAPKRQWLVNWSDCRPMVVDTDMLLSWWPDHPETRSYILPLEVGEAWVDPDVDEKGIPCCSVIRLKDKEES